MTTTKPVWHEVVDNLTAAQQYRLARLQERLNRCGVSNVDHLVLMTAHALAGLKP